MDRAFLEHFIRRLLEVIAKMVDSSLPTSGIAASFGEIVEAPRASQHRHRPLLEASASLFEVACRDPRMALAASTAAGLKCGCDLDLAGRLCVLGETLVELLEDDEQLAMTVPEKDVSSLCLVAAAMDRFGGDGVSLLLALIPGEAFDTEADIMEDPRLEVVASFVVLLLCLGRPRLPTSQALDDALTPLPWPSPARSDRTTALIKFLGR